MDEMHGHIYITGYKTSEEYKALYVYYSSIYEDPIAEDFDNSLRELRAITSADDQTSESPASPVTAPNNVADTDKPADQPDNNVSSKQKEKKVSDSDGKKKVSAKGKAAEKHEKIKQKIDEKYSGKNGKSQKKK